MIGDRVEAVDATRDAPDSSLTPRERARLAETLSAIPPDVHRLLEVGFNDFRITRELSAIGDVVSIDLPHHVAAKPAGSKLVFASVAALPFADETFDLAVCTEVLEHLHDDTLRAGVAELMRTSRRYVLVTVPCRQDVRHELFKCSQCGHEENWMGHVRRIDEDDLKSWFRGWRAQKFGTIGSVGGYAPGWIYSLGRSLGNVWFEYWTGRCPACGAVHSHVRDNAIGWVIRRVIWRLAARAAVRPAWFVAVFERHR